MIIPKEFSTSPSHTYFCLLNCVIASHHSTLSYGVLHSLFNFKHLSCLDLNLRTICENNAHYTVFLARIEGHWDTQLSSETIGCPPDCDTLICSMKSID